MSEIFNNNCEWIHLVLPGLGSKCASGLFCASDLVILSRSRSCYLLWSYMDPPSRGTINHLHCHFSSLPEFPVLGTCRRQGKVSLCPCPRSSHVEPVLPQTWGNWGPWAPPLARSGASCCASKWSWWESYSYPEIRSTKDNGSPSSSHVPVKGTLFLNNLRNI